MNNENQWIEVAKELPDEGIDVDTKIDDKDGVRNEQQLRRLNKIWFNTDGLTYVYYTPTHWRHIN